MLKKSATIIVLSIVLAVLAPLVAIEKYNTVYAASVSDSEAILQPNDLGVEEPSILPTNPFYFLKKWQQDVHLFFTFNKLKKIQNILDYTLEKALELQKITLSAPQNTSAIIKASNNLSDGLDSLQNYTDDFQSGGGFTSLAAQKFLSVELSKGIKLKKFFDQVDRSKISASAKKNMQKTEDKLTKTMVFVPLSFIITVNSQELVASKARDIMNSLDNAEKLEFIIVLDNFSIAYPDSREATLLLKNEFIKNLEENLSKMSSVEFNRFVELNQRVVTLSAQGADIVSSFSKLPVKFNLNKFVVVLENNLIKNAVLKFDSSTSTDVIEATLENLMTNDFYMETDIFYKALQSASSTPEFLASLQNIFIKNRGDFLSALGNLQKNLINKSINLDTWSKNKINITALDGEKYFIHANDLYDKNKSTDAIIALYKAQNRLKDAVSLVAGLKTKSEDNSLCDSDLLNVKDFCLKIDGDFIKNECSALSSCVMVQPKEKAEDESIPSVINNLNNDNEEVRVEKISQNPEIQNCSEKEVVCPSLNKKCVGGSTLQYGGGCAVNFEKCNISEPACPENLENK
ncbi:MAG: DUF5667 domain-containing protein [Patescibacteria group bacterium]